MNICWLQKVNYFLEDKKKAKISRTKPGNKSKHIEGQQGWKSDPSLIIVEWLYWYCQKKPMWKQKQRSDKKVKKSIKLEKNEQKTAMCRTTRMKRQNFLGGRSCFASRTADKFNAWKNTSIPQGNSIVKLLTIILCSWQAFEAGKLSKRERSNFAEYLF